MKRNVNEKYCRTMEIIKKRRVEKHSNIKDEDLYLQVEKVGKLTKIFETKKN